MKSLQERVEELQTIFCEGEELIVKNVSLGKHNGAVIFIVGLIDVVQLGDLVLRPLQEEKTYPETLSYDFLTKSVLFLPQMEETNDIQKVVTELTKGKAILLVEKIEKAIVLNVDKMQQRSITEPPTSSVIKGPRGGFIENYKVNISCIRKILATPHLRTISLEVGRLTKTSVAIMYLDNVADLHIVKQIKEKIKNIDIDGVIDSFYIASYLETYPHSMFKQVGNEEKPDIVAAKMLEGRVAIIVDGSPIVLTLPFILLEDLQSSGDYYDQSARAKFLRWLRVASLLITILFPGMYVAVQLHHYKAMPLKFLITIINSTQELPVTPYVEILFILLLFEVLYEASLRMPTYLGLALSIVGALILGDTAVKAGLVSPPAVMLVAMSGITLYTIPNQSGQLSILRWLFTFAGGCYGFFGIICLTFYLILYLNDFDSYGAPYLSPFSPVVQQDMKDGLNKVDIIDIKTRPKTIRNTNKIRQGRKK